MTRVHNETPPLGMIARFFSDLGAEGKGDVEMADFARKENEETASRS